MQPNFKIIDSKTDPRWDRFVHEHPNGTVYHHSLWMEVLQKTFGHEPVHLILEDGNQQITGILPLMITRGLFGEKKLECLPLTTYCHNLMPETFYPEMIDWLQTELGPFKGMHFKCMYPVQNERIPWSTESHYVNHIIELSGSADFWYKEVINRNIRRRIKTAEVNRLTFREADSLQDLAGFYDLLLKLRRNLGLPPMPFSFFKNMWDILRPRGMLFIVMVHHGDRLITSDIALKYKDTYHMEYNGANPRTLDLAGNQKLLWEVIRMAFENNIRFIDLGRSHTEHDSLIYFKEKWGAKSHPLYSCHIPASPGRNIRKLSRMYRRLNFMYYCLPKPLREIESRWMYKLLG